MIDVTYEPASGGVLGAGVGQSFSGYQPELLADILRGKTLLEMRLGLFVPAIIGLGPQIFVGAGPYIGFSAAWSLDGTPTVSEQDAGYDTPAGELSWDLTFGVGTTVGTWF